MTKQEILKECRKLDDLGRTPDAVRLLSNSIDVSPSDELFFERGVRQERLGDYTAARNDYTASIRLAPKTTKYWVARGLLLCDRLELCKDAIDDLLIAVSIDSTSTIPLQHLSLCYLKLGQPENALIQANKAVTLDPTDGMSHMCLGECKMFLSKFRLAIDHFKEAVNLDPSVEVYRSALARAYFAAGELANARLAYQEAIDVNMSASSLIGLAQVELKAANPQAAIEILNSVTRFQLSEAQQLLVQGYFALATANVSE